MTRDKAQLCSFVHNLRSFIFVVIWKIIAMLTIGIAYYPLFACMETDYKVTGFTIDFLYSAFWLVNVTTVICWEKTFKVHISRVDNY